MATIFERNGTFYLNYAVGGKRVRRVIGSDRRNAELCLQELAYRLHRGDIQVSRPEISIHQAISRFLTACERKNAHSTCKRYESALKHFTDLLTNQFPIQFIHQINKLMILDYAGIRLSQKPKPKRKTVNTELTIIRTFLNYAVEAGYLESNPASKLKLLPETDSKGSQIISQKEIELILSVSDDWFSDIVVFLVHTGLRTGELINLWWSDVDLIEDTITIQPKLEWNPKSYCRTIPINHTVKSIIQKQDQSNKQIFTHQNSQIPSSLLRKRLIRYARMVGLNHLTKIHSLRHTHCTRLLQAGVDIPTVAKLMGHQDWQTTQKYSHVAKNQMRNAVSMLDNR